MAMASATCPAMARGCATGGTSGVTVSFCDSSSRTLSTSTDIGSVAGEGVTNAGVKRSLLFNRDGLAVRCWTPFTSGPGSHGDVNMTKLLQDVTEMRRFLCRYCKGRLTLIRT